MSRLTFTNWMAPDSRFHALYLHDHFERTPLETDPLVRELLARRISVRAPFGGSSWWLDRVCESIDPATTVERAVMQWVAEQPRPVAAVGGEAAIRLAFRHPFLLPIAAAWDGEFDFHDLLGRGTTLDGHFERREQARQQTAVLQVRASEPPPAIWFGCPSDGDRFRGHDRLHEKLSAVGVVHEFIVADECPVATMADFVLAGLEKQSRRLL
jgi:hypothetical protein